MKLRRTIDSFNNLIFSSQDKIYKALRLLNNLNLVAGISILVYCFGGDLDAAEMSKIFGWLELVIVIFVVSFFIRLIYSLHRVSFLRENQIESILVFISVFVKLSSLFGFSVFYNLFLLFGYSDFRSFYELFIVFYILIVLLLGSARASTMLTSVTIKPALTFIGSFIFLILAGTGLLMMPAMTTSPGGMNFLDSLFISTSASCVTGLSVVTVAEHFTFKGQLTILFLLQLGGIGIVSFATFFATFLKQGVGMKQQAIIQDFLSSESLSSAKNMLRRVILLTFSIELIGALVLFFSWDKHIKFFTPVEMEMHGEKLVPRNKGLVAHDGVWVYNKDKAAYDKITAEAKKRFKKQKPKKEKKKEEVIDQDLDLVIAGSEVVDTSVVSVANMRFNNSLSNKIYYSVFHSASAFCNAGFSLFASGLGPDDSNPAVSHSYIMHLVIIFIIIFGSLGYSTIYDVFSPKKMRERLQMPWKDWSLSSKIAINMTIVLTILGAVIYFFIEQRGLYTLSGSDNMFEKIVTSLFQSTTTRTAGFNTVNLGIHDIAPATFVIMIFLMFIGAAPGSTGGGIKTSTFYLLMVSSISSIRGKKTVEIGKRSISNDIISRAFSIVAFAIAYNVVCFFTLLIVQYPEMDMRELFFEQISAFATVGVSTGITADLNAYSKVIIIITMYIGRVGTLTLALALSSSVISTSYKYPTAHVMVG